MSTARNKPNNEPGGARRLASAIASAIATANPVLVVSVMGAAAYFVATLSLRSFYSRFGLEPEDVGLTYTETLGRVAAGLLLVTLVALIGTLIALAYGAKQMVVLLPVFIGILLAVSLLFLPFLYEKWANAVKRGETPPAGFTWTVIANPLGVRAEPVRVSWIDRRQAVYNFGREEVMYLGRAHGVAVFYDLVNERTVHVPDSAIVIQRPDSPDGPPLEEFGATARVTRVGIPG